jgi:hypothetical protein
MMTPEVILRLDAFDDALEIVIPGIPRTKKNSGRIVRRGSSPIILPSAAWESWCKAVAPLLRGCIFRNRTAAIAAPVNCRALFYRDANRGDAVGFYQGLADLLEHGGVVANDKWIVSWDGSRLLKDAENPRVELRLTPIGLMEIGR